MVNHFEERMPRPIIGIAHSMGSVQLYVQENPGCPKKANLGLGFSSL